MLGVPVEDFVQRTWSHGRRQLCRGGLEGDTGHQALQDPRHEVLLVAVGGQMERMGLVVVELDGRRLKAAVARRRPGQVRQVGAGRGSGDGQGGHPLDVSPVLLDGGDLPGDRGQPGRLVVWGTQLTCLVLTEQLLLQLLSGLHLHLLLLPLATLPLLPCAGGGGGQAGASLVARVLGVAAGGRGDTHVMYRHEYSENNTQHRYRSSSRFVSFKMDDVHHYRAAFSCFIQPCGMI